MMASRRDSSRSFDSHSSLDLAARRSEEATRSGDFLAASPTPGLRRIASKASSSRGLGGVAQAEKAAAANSDADANRVRAVRAPTVRVRTVRAWTVNVKLVRFRFLMSRAPRAPCF